jgi:pimeloyl-ACP methyl ester carboxylesterase
VVAISPAVNVRPWPDVKAVMPRQMKATAFLATRLPGLLAAIQRKQQNGIEGPGGQAKSVKAMRKISPDDALLLENEQIYLDSRTTAAEGRRQGQMGGDEFALMSSDWGFDPAAQTLPTTVIFGTGDPLTPMIRAWLAHASGAQAVEVPGGHLQTCLATGRLALIDALLASNA